MGVHLRWQIVNLDLNEQKNRFDLLAGISFKLSKTLYIPQEIVSSDVILRLKRSLEFTVSHCLIFIIEKNPKQLHIKTMYICCCW